MFEKDAKIMARLFFGGPFISWLIVILAFRTDFVCVLAMCIAMVGGYKILWSKLFEKRRTGVLIEWGATQMIPAERKRYFSGYFLIGLSLAIIATQRIIEA